MVIYATMKSSSIRIGIFLYGASMRAALYGLWEFFDLANELTGASAGAVTFKLSAIAEDPSLAPPHLKPLSLSANARPLDVIIVPPQTKKPQNEVCGPLGCRWLADQHRRGTVVASACVGAFVLAESGLLDGRKATTHWMLADDFRQRFPLVSLMDDEILIDEGDILTAGGVTAWLDLALRLVGRFSTPALAATLGKFYLADTGQREQRYYRIFQPRFNHGDASVRAVQSWLATAYRENADNPAMAKAGGLSVRSLQRRFMTATGESPSSYVRKLRLQKASELLETTVMTIDEIVWSVGYEDQSAFSKLFKSQVGLSPSAYRKRFQSLAGHEAARHKSNEVVRPIPA